jgi:hypothetical protein
MVIPTEDGNRPFEINPMTPSGLVLSTVAANWPIGVVCDKVRTLLAAFRRSPDGVSVDRRCCATAPRNFTPARRAP